MLPGITLVLPLGLGAPAATAENRPAGCAHFGGRKRERALLNDTHSPSLESWLESANAPGCDFPITNLPFGVFRRAGSGEQFRGGVAIGDAIVDLGEAANSGALSGDAKALAAACNAPALNAFMEYGPRAWSALRLALSRALRRKAPEEPALHACLVLQSDAEMALPARIGDYTDFYASIEHATSVGKLFRPDNPLLPNYVWVPVAYHGRASSLLASGREFRRPAGQTFAPGASAPVVQPSKRLDYELEMAIWIGTGNRQGTPIPVADAASHVFGLGLLNDWSARDIQAWEYQPLGPFLGKNFATTVSPWIVTLEALEPFRVPWERGEQYAQPLPYLDADQVRAAGAFDVHLEASIETAAMRRAGRAPVRLSHSNFRTAFWTVDQMVAHHTVNGCNLEPGDLLGTGTMSGAAPGEAGSLLELTAGGSRPIALPDGESRTFLQDGDSIVLRAWCEREGHLRIGFGECWGTVLPAS
jgi:fumarylacetoacetase